MMFEINKKYNLNVRVLNWYNKMKKITKKPKLKLLDIYKFSIFAIMIIE